jgi:Ca2+-binding EF-hand superfamily protein
VDLTQTLSLLRDDATRSSVTEVDLSYQNLSDSDATLVCGELMRSPRVSVRVLRLAGNSLQSAVDAVAALMRSATTLRVVDVSDNQLTDGGAHRLLDAATFAEHVTHLYVKGNEAVTTATHDALSTLLTPRAVRAERRARVRALMSRLNDAVCDSDAVSSTAVELVDLGNAGLDGDTLREVVAALLRSPARHSLRKLNLGYNGLTDADVGTLVPLLQQASQLAEIQLDGNNIGNGGAELIAAALRGNSCVVMLDLNDNALGDVGVHALYDMMDQCPRLLKLYVGGNADVSAAAVRRVTTQVRQRAERERRAVLENLKLRATTSLTPQRAAQLKAAFVQYDDDADGLVKLSLLPAMCNALGHAARQEQTRDILVQLDRPAADTGLIDFATFVVVLQRWQETYDQAVIVRNVWQRHAGQRAKVGVDALKAALLDMRKPLPNDNVMAKIVSEVAPDDMQLDEQQFNHLLTCWDYLLKATVTRRCC